MISKSHSPKFCSSLLVIAFLFAGSRDVAEGLKVDLKFYFSELFAPDFGDYLTIQSSMPNLEVYSSILPSYVMVCSHGQWLGFPEVNYKGTPTFLGTTNHDDSTCRVFPANDTKSIRHYGASETTTNGLSLYEERMYTGDEILVLGDSYAGISTPIKSLAATGPEYTQWTLFEGMNFDGRSECITVPNPGYNYYWAHDVTEYYDFTTIGSVIKGCNVSKIEEHKRIHKI